MRTPDEQMSQRRLVEELRIAIDNARSHPRPSDNVLARVHDLVQGNPNGVRAIHVQHNLGRARREWLDAFVRADA